MRPTKQQMADYEKLTEEFRPNGVRTCPQWQAKNLRNLSAQYDERLSICTILRGASDCVTTRTKRTAWKYANASDVAAAKAQFLSRTTSGHGAHLMVLPYNPSLVCKWHRLNPVRRLSTNTIIHTIASYPK